MRKKHAHQNGGKKMKNIAIIEDRGDLDIAFIKFEHLESGARRYKTLVFTNDLWTQQGIIDYANQEKSEEEYFTITFKTINLINNMVIDIKEVYND